MKERLKNIWAFILRIANIQTTFTCKVWQWCLIALVLLVIGMMAGCTGPHPQEGGGARTHIPPRGEVDPPQSVEQALMQPENPEGSSSMFYEEVTQTVYPDGRIETNTRKAGTEVGGSQDLAKILKEYGKSEYMKSLGMALVMFLMALGAYKKGWPLVAGSYAAGGALAIVFVWWAGLIGFVVGTALYIGFKMGLPIDPIEIIK